MLGFVEYALQDPHGHKDFRTVYLCYLNHIHGCRKQNDQKALRLEISSNFMTTCKKEYEVMMNDTVSGSVRTGAVDLLICEVDHQVKEAKRELGHKTFSASAQLPQEDTETKAAPTHVHASDAAGQKRRRDPVDELSITKLKTSRVIYVAEDDKCSVLGSEQDAAPDADEVDEGSVMLEDVTLHSPFCDLIKELYRLYGHDPTKMTLHAKPISSQLLDELYTHGKSLLDSWSKGDPISQKQLLVVLSGIINTIDNVNAPFYAQFAELKKSCIVKDFMTPTKHQVDFVDSMLSETKFLQTMDLNALDIWSLRKSCDLRESMARRSPFYVTPSIESAEEDLTICLLIHTLCKEILLTKNRPCSEQEDVCLWRDVARVLHHGDVIPRIGELSSAAVRSDRRLVEGAISRDRASTQARGRKIDLFFQLKAEKKQPVELFCWEAKTSDAGSTQLQTQRCKNIRLNACLIGTAQTLAGLNKTQSLDSLPSPLILDIAGRTALPYRIRKLEDGIFVAGAVLEDQDLIYLPRAKEDMVEFLREGGLTALLNTKRLNDEYSRTVNDGIRAVKREEAKNRMLGLESSRGCRNPMINTPIKKQKMTTPRTPSPRKNN